MKPSSDRWLAIGALVIAGAIALEARTFRVGFYTDPLGAGGLPFIAAALMASGGLALLVRPKEQIVRANLVSWGRGMAFIASLFLYALVLSTVGFLTATTLVLAAQSAIFGGHWKRSTLLAIAYTAALFLLFAMVLGLPLPIGRVFLRGT